jgi:2-polyprenyl-6-methoxyphenol hydroxylase-like FAD-dependent oxidoreductase
LASIESGHLRGRKGRVILIGDACYARRIARYGRAYVLTQELSAGDGIAEALQRYQRRLSPVIDLVQKSGRRGNLDSTENRMAHRLDKFRTESCTASGFRMVRKKHVFVWK